MLTDKPTEAAGFETPAEALAPLVCRQRELRTPGVAI